MPESDPVTIDPNRHVREYLDYYLNRPKSQNYAVMLSGRWGVGKTFQAERIVRELFEQQGKRYVRISLYGLKSPQEIDDAMVAALYPWTNSDGFRLASAVGKALLKHAKIELPAIKPGDLVNRMSPDVFIFDDLERCRMAVTDVLGYINQLVERDDCKVIILANEAEIHDPAYAVGKEKLVGKTLDVELDFAAAIERFFSSIDDVETRQFFRNHVAEIRAVHDQSNFKNLRLLQQTMWDFERLFVAIDQIHRANHDAMCNLFRVFFILSFEFKAGRLSVEDIAQRTKMSWVDVMRKDTEQSVYSQVGAKYPGFYIHDSMLHDDLTVDLLVRGVIDPQAIAKSLNESSWFIANSEPSWRTLWSSTERREADVEAAAAVMQNEFAARKYDLTGEVLHLFGQMLFLADLGVSGLDREQTVTACKLYVDDLRLQERLESPRDAYIDDIRHGSYGGLGFSQKDTSEFQELWDYVAQQRADAEVESFPADASALIDLMKTDPGEFVRRVTYSSAGSGAFANRPVFAKSDPAAFADALIALEPVAVREVLLGLTSRYGMARLADGRELAAEREWTERLNMVLMTKAETMSAFMRDRISKNLEWTLGNVLRELGETETVRS